jgi:hypothetical protein
LVLGPEDAAPDPVPVDAVAVVALFGTAGAVVVLGTVDVVTLVSGPEFAVEVDVPVALALVDAVELGSDDVPGFVDAGACEPAVADAELPPLLVPPLLVPPVPIETDPPLGSPLAALGLAVLGPAVLDDGAEIVITWARSTG